MKKRTGSKPAKSSSRKTSVAKGRAKTITVGVRALDPLVERVVTILAEAQSGVVRTVNSAMVVAY